MGDQILQIDANQHCFRPLQEILTGCVQKDDIVMFIDNNDRIWNGVDNTVSARARRATPKSILYGIQHYAASPRYSCCISKAARMIAWTAL